MTCCNNPCSAALSLIALLLFAASSPPPVRGQITIPGLRIITGILSPLGIPPISGILPPLGVPSIGTNPIILTGTGQICCTVNGNCPGQGVPALPVSLTCITNNVLGQRSFLPVARYNQWPSFVSCSDYSEHCFTSVDPGSERQFHHPEDGSDCAQLY